jgi:hypothetical protein
MTAWRAGCWPFLLVTATLGCTAADPTTSSSVDEAAVKQYEALLEKKIGLMEEVAGVLKTVDASAASKDNAKLRLVELLAKHDKIEAEIQAYPMKDLRTLAKIRSEAQYRVAQQQQKALKLYTDEIKRINKMPGGEEFFQKDLRQTLEALKAK